MKDEQGMKSDTLATGSIGSVLRCPGGCVHVLLPNFAFRLSEPQYWELMQLLSEASMALRGRPGKAH